MLWFVITHSVNKTPGDFIQKGITRTHKKPHVITGKKLFASEDEVKVVYSAKLELYAAAWGFTLSPMAKCLQSCCMGPPLVNEWQLLDSFIKTTDGRGSGEELEQMQCWWNVNEAAGPFHSLRGWPEPKQPVWAAPSPYPKSGFGWDHGAPAGEIWCRGGNFSAASAGGRVPTAAP